MTGEYQTIQIKNPLTSATILYLCPVAEVNAVMKNNPYAADRPNGKGTVVKDKRIYRHEITIQGEFVSTEEMASDHAAAVKTAFGASSVSAMAQLRRLVALALSTGGSFILVVGDDEYSATSETGVDYDEGGNTFPQAVIDEVRYNISGGISRVPYTVKFIVGFPSSSGSA